MELNAAETVPRAIHVLVVDGCPTDAARSRRLLAESGPGVRVTVAGSLAECRSHLVHHVPDAVVLGRSLPDAPGLAALRALRAQAPGLPVVIVTDEGDEARAEAAIDLGAQDAVPVTALDRGALRRAVDHALVRQAHRRLLDDACSELALEVRRRTEAEQALVRSVAELTRSNAELSAFAHLAAHDLRSPLGALSGFAQLLDEQPAVAGDPEAVEILAHLHEGVRHTLDLVDDLLALSAVDAGPARRAPVDLSALAAEVCGPRVRRATRAAEGCPVGEGNGASVEIGELPTVLGDEGQLRRLLDNLISNALKFVPADRSPRVAVTAERVGDGWCLDVTDNGIGIEPAARERVFAMFERLRRQPRVPGNGIGLAICRRIVEQHHGRIWIEGTEPTGTRVRVWLPAAP